MLLCGGVAVWSNPDLTPPRPEYAAWVAGTLVAGFLVTGGWRVTLIALGAPPRSGDRVYLGLCALYAVAVLLYGAHVTLGV
jgi:hypothetical protein